MILAKDDHCEIGSNCLPSEWFAAFESGAFEVEWLRLWAIAHQRLHDEEIVDASLD